MKRILLFLFFIAGCSLVTKADTIDYCHVHYNHVLRWDFGIGKGQYKIVIDKANVHSNDSIQIYHFDDTPCGVCAPVLVLKIGNSFKFISQRADCFSIAVNDLFKLTAGQNSNYIRVLYRETSNKNEALQIFMIDSK